MNGFEEGHEQPCGFTIFGTAPAFATDNPRTGVYSLKHGSGLGGRAFQRAVNTTNARRYWVRTYIYVAAGSITLNHGILEIDCGSSAVWSRAFIDTSGNLAFNTSAGGLTSTGVAFPRDQWVLLEFGVTVDTAANDTFDIYMNGVSQMATQSVAWSTSIITAFIFGNNVGNSAQVNMWWDDIAINDDQTANQNGRPGDGKIYYLFAAGAGTAGTAEANWTKPGGATTNKETSVDNAPPIFLADSTSGADAESMLRNPTNAASDLTLLFQSYTSAGIASYDTITVVRAHTLLGSSSATATTGTILVVSNPTGDAGTSVPNYGGNGVASATSTTWVRAGGTFLYNPSVVVGTGPEIRLSRAATAFVTLVNQMNYMVEVIPGTPPGAVAAGTFDPLLLNTAWF